MQFDKNLHNILFFVPESSVTPHFLAMCLVAKDLQHRGYKPVFALCPALFQRCPVMDMYQLSYESFQDNRQNVCPECIIGAVDVLRTLGFSWVNIQDFISPKIIELVNSAVSKAPVNFKEFEFEGVPIGKIAFGDLAIATKIGNADLSDPAVRVGWSQYATSALLSYIAVDRICAQIPVRRMLRFNEYANNLAAYFAAKKHGIPSFTLSMPSHLGIDCRKILIFGKVWIQQLKEELKQWHLWRDVPIPADLIHEITDDVFDRFSGRSIFTYSPSRTNSHENLRHQLGVPPGKKLLVAFTSSPDERRFTDQLLEIIDYHEPPPDQTFADHVEWLNCLINYVEQSSDLQLIIRIHPREAPNKRDDKMSAHLEILKTHFSEEYENCRVIWPTEDVSSYDLIEIADLGLTAWSTIGIEMARLGVPVVSAFRKISFPEDEFLRWGGPSHEKYLSVMREVLDWEPTIDSLLRAFRCYQKYRLGPYVSYSDKVLDRTSIGTPDWSTPSQSAKLVEEVIIDGKDVLYSNLEAFKNGANPQEEREALIVSMQRVLWNLITGEELPSDIQLCFLDCCPTEQTEDPSKAYISPVGSCEIALDYLDRRFLKFSPLGRRLLQVFMKEKTLRSSVG